MHPVSAENRVTGSGQEQSSRLVDEDLLGGFGLRRFVGSFDELAVDEQRAGTHECN
jgi:hypothetical protein